MRYSFLLLIGLFACNQDNGDSSGKPDGTGDPDDTGTPEDTADTGETGETGETGDSDTGTVTEPDQIVLTLGAPDADPDEAVSVSAQVFAAGTPVDAVVTYEVSPGGATLAGDSSSVTATEDGVYTVTATSGSLQDAETFTVDSNGPMITLTSARATWVGLGAGELSFAVVDNVHDVGLVTTNSLPATADSGGYLGSYTLGDEGIGIVTAEALDQDTYPEPNASDLVYAVVAGTTSPLDSALERSIEVRANQGMLDAMAATIESTFDASAIESALLATNPLVDTTISCLGVSVEATALAWDAIEPQLIPSSAGLQLQLDVVNFTLDLTTYLDACGGGTLNYPGTISASNIHVVSDLTFAVPAPGDVDVTMTEPDITFTDLEVDLGGADDLLAAFGMSVEDLGLDIEGLLADELGGALTDAVPGAVEAALEQISISQTFDAVGASITLEALISNIVTDSGGMTLQLDTTMANDGSYPGIPVNPGSLLLTGDAPDYTSVTDDLGLSMELDDFNRLLHLAWDAGAFHQSITGINDGLTIGALGVFFPGLESVDIALTPLLPPVLTPGGETSALELTIGEMQLDISGTVSGTYQHLTTGYAVIIASVDLDLADGAISLNAGEPEVLADIPSVDPNGVAADEQLEAVISFAAGSLVGDLLPSITFAIPDLPGLGFTPGGVQTLGSNDTWVTVTGSLAE